MRQVITGSHDKMIKMWDLRKGKTMATLTYHKKSVRAMAMHPKQFAFAAASADNIKKYQLPQARPRSDRHCQCDSCLPACHLSLRQHLDCRFSGHCVVCYHPALRP